MTDEKDGNKNESKSGVTLTSIIISIVILLFAGSFAKGMVRGDHSAVANWKTYTIGTIEPRLSLTAPSEPKLLNIKIPEALSNITQKIEWYECSSSPEGVTIQILGTIYNTEVTPSLQGGINGAIKDVSNLEGVTNVQHNTTQIIISGRNTTLLTITADLNGKKLEQKTLFFIDGLKLRQVNIQYEAPDKVGRDAAQRVIDSLSI